jgi:hypothetical protein
MKRRDLFARLRWERFEDRFGRSIDQRVAITLLRCEPHAHAHIAGGDLLASVT